MFYGLVSDALMEFPRGLMEVSGRFQEDFRGFAGCWRFQDMFQEISSGSDHCKRGVKMSLKGFRDGFRRV